MSGAYRGAWRVRQRQTELAATARIIGHIDDPQPGSTVERRHGVTIRGWHLWDGAPPAAVTVAVQGVLVAAGLVGTEVRTDVAEAHARPELAEAGWSLTADLGRVSGEETELLVTLWPTFRGAPAQLPPIPVNVVDPGETVAPGVADSGDASRVVGRLEIPLEGTVLDRDVVPVVGWALTPAAPVHAVDVIVDGEPAGRARLGLPRRDVADHYAGAHALVSGYEAVLDLTHLPESTASVTVEVVATAADGSRRPVDRRTFEVAAPVDRPPAAAPASADRTLWSRVVPRSPGDGLNLAVFTHQLGYGGGQLWLSELLDVARAGRDFPCTVIAPVDGPLRHDLERAGIDVHLTQDVTVRDAAGYEGRITETALLLAELGTNAVLVNTTGQFAGADAANRIGLPVVWAIHESFSLERFWHAAYGAGVVHPNVRDAAASALRDSAVLVFEAEATRQQYLTWSSPERCVVVRYGINTAAITEYMERVSRSEARARLDVPESCRLLLVVGTTEPRKAQTLLAEAFAALGDHHRDLVLAFVGDTGSDYAAALSHYAADAQLGERVRLIPVTKDVYSWYRAADVLVSGSDVESLPRSALEAMCFGVPVLATAIFGLPDLIDDGATGFLFEPQDLGAATEALRRVADLDAAELERVGRAARRHVLEHYDSTGYANDIRALLAGLCADPTRLPATLLTTR